MDKKFTPFEDRLPNGYAPIATTEGERLGEVVVFAKNDSKRIISVFYFDVVDEEPTLIKNYPIIKT